MRVSMIGIGRLGLPLALLLAKGEMTVMACDSNKSYVEAITKGTFRSKEPGVEDLLEMVDLDARLGRATFEATTDLDATLQFSDTILILVPTPTGVDQPYDTTILSNLLVQINKRKIENKHLVICCTVAPGYCDTVPPVLLSDCTNVHVSYSPEFVAQGEVIKGFENASLALIGSDGGDLDALHKIHKILSPNAKAHVMTRLEAEIAKLAINSFLSIKIAYGNHIGDMCECLGADSSKVMGAVGQDPRIGRALLQPGYAAAGPCIPRDTRALALVAADKTSISPRFLSSINEEHDRHSEFMARSILENSGGTEIHFPFCTYKFPCAVDMIDASAVLSVATKIRRESPDTKVILHDRPAVIDLVRQRYGSYFHYLPELLNDKDSEETTHGGSQNATENGNASSRGERKADVHGEKQCN